jgi:uncharacterized repeat protein (TIGR03803 family)
MKPPANWHAAIVGCVRVVSCLVAVAAVAPHAAFGQYSVIHSFAGGQQGNSPNGGLEVDGSVIYGTTENTIFKLNTDGTNHQVLRLFFSPPVGAPINRVGTKLFGTSGDVNNAGNLFWMNTDGTGFQVLHTFTNSPSDGNNPNQKMTVSGSVLYGTTSGASQFDGTNGTLFKINSDGTGYGVVHEFTGADGQAPQTPTVIGSTVYGGASFGGLPSAGTLYRGNTDGTGFTTPHTFNGSSDGRQPTGPLAQVGSKLFGVTRGTGLVDGTLFSINLDGSDFQILHTFAGGASDGLGPFGGLLASGSTLVGTTLVGGVSNQGTIFSIEADGSGFQVLHSFVGGALGSIPSGNLTLVDGVFYGTTFDGGTANAGTVFTFIIPEPAGYVLAVLALCGFLGWALRSRRSVRRGAASGV